MVLRTDNVSFTNIYFIFILLPAILILISNIPNRIQKPVLIASGLVFYMLSAGWWGLAIPLTTAVNYGIHRLINKPRNRGMLTALTVILNAGLLIAAKLSGYMPLGLCFYIFQMISLMIDTRDERLSPDDFCIMSMFFPKLIMGPIVRYRDMKSDLRIVGRERMIKPDKLERGLKLYTVGLFMKVVLADNLATLWNSLNIAGVYGLATPTAWLGAVTYSLELYLDFWGYSLMAMALGYIFGLPLAENFNEPYSAAGVGDFYRRWHITLGTWFRDYVYIPLGGNRKGRVSTMRNLVVVWLLTGFWHGITVNFLIWAGLLFILIILERYTLLGRLAKAKVLGHIYTVVVIVISWVIFAIHDPSQLWVYIKCMFGVYSEGSSPSVIQFVRLLRTYWYLILAGAFFATPLPRRIYEKHSRKLYFIAPLVIMAGLSIFFMLHNNGNVFMYYAF